MEYIIKIKKKGKHLFNDAWVWRMAWQDGRKNVQRLMLFVASIIVGIASIVAIDSFNGIMNTAISKFVRAIQDMLRRLAPGLVPLPFDTVDIAVDTAACDQYDRGVNGKWLSGFFMGSLKSTHGLTI